MSILNRSEINLPAIYAFGLNTSSIPRDKRVTITTIECEDDETHVITGTDIKNGLVYCDVGGMSTEATTTLQINSENVANAFQSEIVVGSCVNFALVIGRFEGNPDMTVRFTTSSATEVTIPNVTELCDVSVQIRGNNSLEYIYAIGTSHYMTLVCTAISTIDDVLTYIFSLY